MRFLGLLPRPPLWRKSVAPPAAIATGGRHKVWPSARTAREFRGGRERTRAATGCADGRGSRLGRGPPGTRRANGARLQPRRCVSRAGCARRACVIDVASGQLMARLPNAEAQHGSMVWSASFSPDGKRLAMSSYGSNEVLVYDVPTWQATATIRYGASSVFSVAFSRTGEWLATGAPPGLQLWRVGRYEAPAAQVGTSGLVWSIAFQPDGSGLIVAGQGLQAWSIMSGDGGSVSASRAAASRPIGAHAGLCRSPA